MAHWQGDLFCLLRVKAKVNWAAYQYEELHYYKVDDRSYKYVK